MIGNADMPRTEDSEQSREKRWLSWNERLDRETRVRGSSVSYNRIKIMKNQ